MKNSLNPPPHPHTQGPLKCRFTCMEAGFCFWFLVCLGLVSQSPGTGAACRKDLRSQSQKQGSRTAVVRSQYWSWHFFNLRKTWTWSVLESHVHVILWCLSRWMWLGEGNYSNSFPFVMSQHWGRHSRSMNMRQRNQHSKYNLLCTPVSEQVVLQETTCWDVCSRPGPLLSCHNSRIHTSCVYKYLE